MWQMLAILGQKWLNTKFVFLYWPRAIFEFTLVMCWITLVRTEVDILIAQVSLINALILGNLCNFHYKSYTSEN